MYLGGSKKVPEEGCYLFLHTNNDTSVINCFYATRPVCPESQENWYIYFDFSSSNSAAGWRWSLFFPWPFFFRRREPGVVDRPLYTFWIVIIIRGVAGHNEWMYRLIKAPFRRSYPWLRLMPKRRVASNGSRQAVTKDLDVGITFTFTNMNIYVYPSICAFWANSLIPSSFP